MENFVFKLNAIVCRKLENKAEKVMVTLTPVKTTVSRVMVLYIEITFFCLNFDSFQAYMDSKTYKTDCICRYTYVHIAVL
jgi:hypothetical protein